MSSKAQPPRALPILQARLSRPLLAVTPAHTFCSLIQLPHQLEIPLQFARQILNTCKKNATKCSEQPFQRKVSLSTAGARTRWVLRSFPTLPNPSCESCTVSCPFTSADLEQLPACRALCRHQRPSRGERRGGERAGSPPCLAPEPPWPHGPTPQRAPMT